MSYPPVPPGGSPEWPGQQPEWQGQQPEWQGQHPAGWQPQQPPGWQGQPPPAGWPAPQPGWQEPENYLVWAILCTVLCCLPFGIVSIVYSNKVSGLWAQGRYAEAHEASNNAKKWAIIGAIVGVVAAVIGVIVTWFGFMAAVVSNIPSTTTTTYPGF
ncbi:hypothetical protein A5760_25315 [Mycobacterium colombiense]|uniref:CD225/dispanin family protein n=1 Tax=Mycobacterium colombiense TaxID=339268 RepID=A0A1A0VWL4_9MYCO|nr:CD225/dispanin family protein [Mycobacterium colombiense]OBB87618.1 hypothetical protein A5760_25315 [Mycobacterium colombiense]